MTRRDRLIAWLCARLGAHVRGRCGCPVCDTTERDARAAIGMPAAHPERITRELPGGQEEWLAALAADAVARRGVRRDHHRRAAAGPAMNGPVPGPFETEQQALALPAVQAIYAAARASRRRGVMAEHSHRLLDEACTAAGATPGAYDHRILTWLAGWEPQICAVVAALITRAHAAGAGRAALAC